MAMQSETRQENRDTAEANSSSRRPYSKPTLENFGLVSEVTAGGRGSEPEQGSCDNQGRKKRDDPDCQ